MTGSGCVVAAFQGMRVKKQDQKECVLLVKFI